jgi:hypothetical protein
MIVWPSAIAPEWASAIACSFSIHSRPGSTLQ